IVYQRIASQNTREELSQLELEISDRYGHPPIEVINYFEMMKLRILLKKMGISELNFKNEYLNFKIADQHRLNPEKILSVCLGRPKKYKLSPRGIISIRTAPKFINDLNLLSGWIESEFKQFK